ncbi:MAG: DUF4255 domain-containing protein [Anaerolineae bacterium]|nr:DUF4255 domain-containing protein [Anaerolineae bacterium]
MKTSGLINDLNQTLKELLTQATGLTTDDADITFEIPSKSQPWASDTGKSKPTINLYLYDLRENRELREVGWDWEEERERNGRASGRVKYTRRPMRINLSYMITCWAGDTETEHALLWMALETFSRHSPIPNEVLQGALDQLDRPIRTEVAQPDGVLKNVSDFWGALENNLRPSVNLTVTLDLDLGEQMVSRLFSQKSQPPYASLTRERAENLVYARVVKLGEADIAREEDKQGRRVGPLVPKLMPPERYIALPLEWGATVRDKNTGHGVKQATVTLMYVGTDGLAHQFGDSIETGDDGRFRFKYVPAGTYTVKIKFGDYSREQVITLQPPPEGDNVSNLIFEVEGPMT